MKIRKLLLSIGVVLGVAIAGLAIWLIQLDARDIVGLIERQATLATGRALRIGGQVSMQWSLIPTVAVEDVRLQNAPWGSQPDMLSVKRAEVQLALMPLFSGEVRIRKIVLDAPQLLLEVSGKGERNWVFKSADKPADPQARKLAIDIAELGVSRGALVYRPAAPAKAVQLRIETLALKSATAETAQLDGKLAFNDIPIAFTGSLPSVARFAEGVSVMPLDFKLDSMDVKLALAGNVSLGQPSLEGTALRFKLEAPDPAASAKQLKVALSKLPRTEVAGQLLLGKAGLHLADLAISSGKSKAQLDVRMPLGAARVALVVKLNVSHLDLPELLGPPLKTETPVRKGGRIFSDAALPLDGLTVVDAKGSAQVARLVMRDGRVVQSLATQFALERGRLALEPVTLIVDGKTLRAQIRADASSGKSVGINASVDAKGVPLASLAALAGVTASPQGAPTDVAITFASRGGTVRQLMAAMDGNVRVVVGPDRWKGSAFDLGPELTSVMDVIFPGGRGELTELQCAAFRFPVTGGIARLDNGVGVETQRIKLSANGTVNLREETLNLGVRPKAVTRANIDVGNLAQLVRIGGTLSAPTTGLDAASAATTAIDLGVAIARGGKGLSKSVFADTAPDNPCEIALGAAPRQAGVEQRPQPAPSTAKTVTDTLDAVRGLFGK